MDDELRPRRGPSQERSQQTVDAVFEAMLQVLERHDTSDPTMQAIADRAGVSVGSMYQYFPSKRALTSALIGFHLRKKMGELRRAIDAAKGLEPEAAAAHLVEAILDDKRRHSKVERALLRSFIRVGDLATLTEYDAQMVGMVRELLEALGSGVRSTDLSLAAFIVSNALRTAVLLSIADAPDRFIDPTFKAELVHLVVSYLRPR